MKNGFTLIELLVVVLIIGLLSAVALPQYEMAVLKSRMSTVLPLVRGLYEAQQVYYMANNSYAEKLEDLDVTVPPGGSISPEGNIFYFGTRQMINLCSTCASIQGYPDLNQAVYIEFYFDGRKMCWANISSVRANKLCQNLAGKSAPDSSNARDNGYLIN